MTDRRKQCLEKALVPDEMLFIDSEDDYLDVAIVGVADIEGRTVAVYDYDLLLKAYYDHMDPSLYENEQERYDNATAMVDDAMNLIFKLKQPDGYAPVIVDMLDT